MVIISPILSKISVIVFPDVRLSSDYVEKMLSMREFDFGVMRAGEEI